MRVTVAPVVTEWEEPEMAQMRYFAGNGGFYSVDEFEMYDVGSLSGGLRILTFADVDAFDPTQSPYSIVFTYAGIETSVATTGPFAGQSIATDGTLTKITYRNSDGGTIAELSGLNIDAALADAYIRSGRGFELYQLAVSGRTTFTGSENSRIDQTDEDAWDGDDISTGGGDDIVRSLGGDDFIKDRGGRDSYDGGAGFDVVSYEQSFWDTMRGVKGIDGNLQKGIVKGYDGQVDKLKDIEGLRGSVGHDKLTGSKSDNWFDGGIGRDTIDGGAGWDTIAFRNDDRTDRGGGNFGVTVQLGEGKAAGFAIDGFGTRDTLRNIEGINGSRLGDSLTGNSAANYIEGRQGDDTITGGGGNDELRGGDGADQFVFANNTSGQDRIRDFQVEQDILVLTGATAATIETLVTLSAHEDGTLLSFTGGTGTVVLEGVEVGTVSADLLFGFGDV